MSSGVCCFLLLASASAAAPQHATFILPETGQKISVTQSLSSASDPTGPGVLAISSGEHAYRIHLNYAAVQIKGNAPRGLHVHSSGLFFTGSYAAEGTSHTLLFFIGQAGASDADPLTIIGFKPGGAPFKALELRAFWVSALDASGNSPRIIGKATLSQVQSCLDYDPSSSPYATTYDPFSVYLLSGVATYSLPESRSYNMAHYVWAGPRMREDYAVLYNLAGRRHPFGATQRRASTLLPRCKDAKK